jgi:hypothetical protein
LSARRETGIALATLAAVAAALHFRQLVLGETWILRDHLVYTWTERKVLADALRALRVPEWNPLVGFGTEFAASSANGVTYPPLWLLAVLPLPFGMDLLTAAHVLLAGAGAALLSRRLGATAVGCVLAGAALMCSGYVASIAPNKIFAGTAWIPWVFWAADRVACASPDRRALVRAAAVLAAVVAAQLLAGDPAASITAALGAVAVVLARAGPRRAPLLATAAGGAGGLLLAAAGVLPGLALLPHTSRASLSASEGTSWSLHPLRLLELFWPRALGDPVDPAASLAVLVADVSQGALEPSWSYSLFLGAPLLALAALAALRGLRGARGLLLGALLFLVLALGPHTPLYPAFRALFPPESIVRYPEKHAAGAIVLLCALAGAGLTELQRRPGRAGPAALAAALGILGVPLAAAAALRDRILATLAPGAELAGGIDVGAALATSLRSGAVALSVAAAASLALLASARQGWARAAGPLAVALLVGHAAAEAWAVAPVARASELRRRPALLARVLPADAPRGDAPPPRVLRSPLVDAALPPRLQAAYRQETLVLDAPGRWGVAAVPGFEGWRSRAFTELWRSAGGMTIDGFLTLYGIDWVALPRELAPALFPAGRGRGEGVLAQLTLDVASAGRPRDAFGWTVVRVEGVRPRAFVAPRWRWVAPAAAVPATVDAARGRDAGLVVLSGEGGAPSPVGHEGLPLAPCTVTAHRPERVALSCASPAGGQAVLVEENAPGWTATVDGAPAPIVTADALLRSVAVEPGTHEIVFSYRTPLLRAGAAVSLLAWIAWVALVARGLRARARPDGGTR